MLSSRMFHALIIFSLASALTLSGFGCGNKEAANPEVDSAGRTPLHLAAAAGDTAQMRYLLSHGAPVEAKTNRGTTPIWSAVSANNLEAVRMLAEEDADLNVKSDPFGALIDYAFYTESRLGWSGITDFLIGKGVKFDPNAPMLTGEPRVFIADWFGHTEMLQYLLTFDPDVNVRRSDDGATPLIDVIKRGNPDAAVALLEHGADMTLVDNDGRPAIYYAAKLGVGRAVGALLQLDAPFNYIEPETGRSLLHLAAIAGDWTAAQQLIVAGAMLDLKDDNHERPIELAGQYGNKMVAKTLELHNATLMPKMEQNYGKSDYLTEPPVKGQAVAWYLRKRGWAIKTAGHLLVFDSEEGRAVQSTNPCLANGSLSLQEIKDENILSLYTTYHGGGEDKERIHYFEDSVEQIAYIHNANDPWRGCVNTTYMNRGDTLVAGDVTVVAIAPIDPEEFSLLAYLIKVDGLSIFYTGFHATDLDYFAKGIATIKERVGSVDLAFLPLPEPGTEDSSDFKYVVEHLNPKTVCILDPERREYLFPAMALKAAEWGYKGKIFCAGDPGDHFVFKK